MELLWVFVDDLTRIHRDEYFYTTDTPGRSRVRGRYEGGEGDADWRRYASIHEPTDPQETL